MHRNGRLRVSIIALIALCAGALVGCPGRLTDPERFGGGTQRDGGGSDEDAGADDSVEALLAESCDGSGCHGESSPALGLDLVSPGLAERLVGVPAVGCPTRMLVDEEDRGNSFLLEKVTDAAPECGGRMPLLADALTTEQQDALRTWIEGL